MAHRYRGILKGGVLKYRPCYFNTCSLFYKLPFVPSLAHRYRGILKGGFMEYRTEYDSLGSVTVPAEKYWGAQTERSRQNFKIGTETMPPEIITAYAIIKKAAALTNLKLQKNKMSSENCNIICAVCDEIIQKKLNQHFPLVVWQTGSGTQTNMNVNEVIAYRAHQLNSAINIHPNDIVNMSQSSNDTFPSAIHIAGVLEIEDKLLPALKKLIAELKLLEKNNKGIVKGGRTHCQDATPILFSQEISAWRYSAEQNFSHISQAVTSLYELCLGGTAVGTGLNAPKKFDTFVVKNIAKLTKKPFTTSKNKFHGLTSKNEVAFTHGALKALAGDLFKLANDIRLLSSGPRTGLGEINIPANEPGSSIMPGKVNPTQTEALTMACVQVMGNDVAIGLAASQGHFQLNVFMPVLAYNFLQSIRLLTDVINSFREHCLVGLTANKQKMAQNLHNSLMNGTILTPILGYEKTCQIVQKADAENTSLKDACLQLGFLTENQFDDVYKPERLV